MTTDVILREGIFFPANTPLAAGATVTLPDDLADTLVAANKARYAVAPVVTPRDFTAAERGGLQALVSGDVISGAWRDLPASGVVMRVRMTGTGTVSMDSATGRLGAGTVTTGVYAASVSGVQIDDFAYPGDAARSIRFTLTGTAAVEVY